MPPSLMMLLVVSSNHSKMTSISIEREKGKSNKPDYDEDKDQLEEDQEEETGEMTINQAF